MNRSLLIVDDEPNVINSLKRQLRHKGYDIYSAQSGDAGLNLLKRHSPAVVLSDQMMPEMDGVAFLESVKEVKPDAVRILLTGHGSLESAMAAVKRSQIFEYLTKPWSAAGIKQSISRAFYRTAREIARSHHEHWDGSGYPDRLMANEIPLPARIVIVADVFDALTHERVYKKALSVEEARSRMKNESGKLFAPEILEVFLDSKIHFPEETAYGAQI